MKKVLKFVGNGIDDAGKRLAIRQTLEDITQEINCLMMYAGEDLNVWKQYMRHEAKENPLPFVVLSRLLSLHSCNLRAMSEMVKGIASDIELTEEERQMIPEMMNKTAERYCKRPEPPIIAKNMAIMDMVIGEIRADLESEAH